MRPGLSEFLELKLFFKHPIDDSSRHGGHNSKSLGQSVAALPDRFDSSNGIFLALGRMPVDKY